MLARILVPLDGSARAERAIPVAAKLARNSNGTVILARAYQRVVAYGPAFVPPPKGTSTTSEARETVLSYLDALAQQPILAGVAVETEFLEGDPAYAIVAALPSLRADVIVLTSHGRTGVARWALGSVAQHLVRHASVPVLVLRQSGPTPLSPAEDTERTVRTLIPLDGSDAAEELLPHAIHVATALAAPAQAALHLVYVAAPSEFDRANMPEALVVDGAKQYLSRTAARLRAQLPNAVVTWSVASNLDIAEALIQIAENRGGSAADSRSGGYDLVALSSFYRSGINRLVMGSIAERVLWNTNRPTLVVPIFTAVDSRSAAQKQRVRAHL